MVITGPKILLGLLPKTGTSSNGKKSRFNSIHIIAALKGKYTSMQSPAIKNISKTVSQNISPNLTSFATNHHNQPITSSPLECHH